MVSGKGDNPNHSLEVSWPLPPFLSLTSNASSSPHPQPTEDLGEPYKAHPAIPAASSLGRGVPGREMVLFQVPSAW